VRVGVEDLVAHFRLNNPLMALMTAITGGHAKRHAKRCDRAVTTPAPSRRLAANSGADEESDAGACWRPRNM